MPCDFNRRQMVRSLLLGGGLFPAVLERSCIGGGSVDRWRPRRRTSRARRSASSSSTSAAACRTSIRSIPNRSSPNTSATARPARTAARCWARRGPPSRTGNPASKSPTSSPTSPSAWTTCASSARMRGDHNDHFQATLGIHTGSVTFKRPSVGLVGHLRPGHGESEPAVLRGAGAGNAVLPAARSGRAIFCPASIPARASPAGRNRCPISIAAPPSPEMQKLELSLLDRFNRKHEQQPPGRPDAGRAHQMLRDRVRHADDDAAGARPFARRPTPR